MVKNLSKTLKRRKNGRYSSYLAGLLILATLLLSLHDFNQYFFNSDDPNQDWGRSSNAALSIDNSSPPEIVDYLPYVEYAYASTGNMYTFGVADDSLTGWGTYVVEVKFPFVGYQDVYVGTWSAGSTTAITFDLNMSLPFIGMPRGLYDARITVTDQSGLTDTVAVKANIIRTTPPEIVDFLPYVEYAYNSTGNVYTFGVADDSLTGWGTYVVEVKFPFVGYQDVYVGTWSAGNTTAITFDLNVSLPFIGMPRGLYDARITVTDQSGLTDTVAVKVNIIR